MNLKFSEREWQLALRQAAKQHRLGCVCTTCQSDRGLSPVGIQKAVMDDLKRRADIVAARFGKGEG